MGQIARSTMAQRLSTVAAPRGLLRALALAQAVLVACAWLAPSVAAVNPMGLVSWWPAEGSANDAHGANNGTLVSGAGFAAGIDGSRGLDMEPDWYDLPVFYFTNPAAVPSPRQGRETVKDPGHDF